MRSKLRMYIAAGSAGTTGSATGLIAAHMGMDPVQAASLGSVVSGATGDLLRQLLGVSEHDLPNTSTASAVTARTAANTSSTALEVFRPLPRQRPPLPAATGPMARRVAHHGRHRQLQRTAWRFSQRAAVREGDGHGAA
ncbi:hypothetical protein [Streptomyces sp. NPDC101776]|uniref:hypothetical protein n=1 Tax=Streptomyces sp. NPDC101776 TaxID=3366146 RepID=UPI0037F312EB